MESLDLGGRVEEKAPDVAIAADTVGVGEKKRDAGVFGVHYACLGDVPAE